MRRRATGARKPAAPRRSVGPRVSGTKSRWRSAENDRPRKRRLAAIEKRNEEKEGEELPEPEPSHGRLQEGGHAAVDRGRREALEGGRNLAEGLRSRRARSRALRPGVVRTSTRSKEFSPASTWPDELEAGREGVAEISGGRPAQLFEVAHEALVEQRLELAGEVLPGDPAGLRPLEVLARDGPVLLLGGPDVPEERAVRRLAAVGIADGLCSRGGRRAREGQELRESGRGRAREDDGQKREPGEARAGHRGGERISPHPGRPHGGRCGRRRGTTAGAPPGASPSTRGTRSRSLLR